MLTNMNFPTDVWATISPGLLHDRVPSFRREAHQLKITLKPVPRTPVHGRNQAIRVTS
ncbi:MAG TPA: hypothetical protein VGS11_02350 [Candidatus Bathyarchaeia archaeon]|nr:hypothetical protein [Candidatus Bathyarchaeia archaeon]